MIFVDWKGGGGKKVILRRGGPYDNCTEKRALYSLCTALCEMKQWLADHNRRKCPDAQIKYISCWALPETLVSGQLIPSPSLSHYPALLTPYCTTGFQEAPVETKCVEPTNHPVQRVLSSSEWTIISWNLPLTLEKYLNQGSWVCCECRLLTGYVWMIMLMD